MTLPPIARIIHADSHLTYLAQVFIAGEVPDPPPREALAFGTFVRIDLDDADPTRWLMALIHDTLLLNPAFGRLGPRLSPPAELAVFSPDYLQEEATLIGLLAMGQVVDGQIQQGLPPLAATGHAAVRPLSPDVVRAFHLPEGEAGGVQLSYLPLLAASGARQNALTQCVLSTVRQLCPSADEALTLLQSQLSQRSQLGPWQGGA